MYCKSLRNVQRPIDITTVGVCMEGVGGGGVLVGSPVAVGVRGSQSKFAT